MNRKILAPRRDLLPMTSPGYAARPFPIPIGDWSTVYPASAFSTRSPNRPCAPIGSARRTAPPTATWSPPGRSISCARAIPANRPRQRPKPPSQAPSLVTEGADERAVTCHKGDFHGFAHRHTGLAGPITWLAQKSGANVGFPPTAAAFRTIRGPSTLSGHSFQELAYSGP